MVLLGGPEVSYNAKEYILNNEADFVINNEGEESFHLLLAALHNNTPLFDVPNLVYKDEKIVETNTILPNLENVKLATTNVLDYKNRIVYLESSRGCPYRCSYCVASTSNKVRMFPLDSVLNILNTLMKERVKTVKFLDRTFNADPKYLITILDYIEENNIKSGSVFVSKNGKPLDRSNIWSDMKKLCERAGVSKDKVFPHNLRHLFARTYYSLQKDIIRLADVLGHSNINTTRIYTIESGDTHRKQLQKLGLLRC
jgi:radical SAM superfamily enzyme YgiQ (UPF0313 family)